MSTGADCRFEEVEPGRWTYRIQRWPYGEWDEYDTHGPFPSFRKAVDHLDSMYANPGGYSLGVHPTGHVHEFELDYDGKTMRCNSCPALREEARHA